jgi:integrase
VRRRFKRVKRNESFERWGVWDVSSSKVVQEPAVSGCEVPHWVIKRAVPDTGGALPAGFPYIIDDISGQLCEVALLYMTETQLVGTPEKLAYQERTVDAYTSDIRDWLRFTTNFHIPWNKATWVHLQNYIDTMQGDIVSPHHGEHYKSTTPDRRLVTIKGLYKWAADNLKEHTVGAPRGTLFSPKVVAEYLDKRRKELRLQTKPGHEPVADIELTSVMLDYEVRATLEAIGPAPREPSEDAVTDFAEEETSPASVGHVGMSTGLYAGLRVSEVVELEVAQFKRYFNVKVVPNRLYTIGPIRRKGGKWKKVSFSGVLLEKVLNYIHRERKFAMRDNQVEHGRLLVHKCGWRRGQPICKSTLQRRFAKACMAAGVKRTVLKMRPVDGSWSNISQREEERAKYTFHDLRHTYAVWTYHARRLDGDAEPWKFIQEQLGHQHVSTTIKIYLAVTGEYEAFISDGFQYELNRTAGIFNVETEAEAA